MDEVYPSNPQPIILGPVPAAAQGIEMSLEEYDQQRFEGFQPPENPWPNITDDQEEKMPPEPVGPSLWQTDPRQALRLRRYPPNEETPFTRFVQQMVLEVYSDVARMQRITPRYGKND